MKGRIWSSIVLAAIGAGLLLAAGFASPAEGGSQASDRSAARGGTLRVDFTPNDFDYIDTSLAYFSHSWQMLNATQLKLISFPDKEGAAGSRMRPEAAAGFPRVSRDGRTYTFTIKRGFRFSNGAPVTSANFRAAIARALNPRMQSPASSFLDDVQSYRTPNARTLVVRLKKVAPDFLARMSMPFFSAIPTNRPIVPEGVDAPLVSAGPYFLQSWDKRRTAVAVRNPHWNNNRAPWRALGRPALVDRIVWNMGITPAASRLRVENNETDLGYAAPAQYSEIAQRYGINRGRFFIRKNIVFWYLALNNNSPLFRNNARLRQAVNHAIDRPQMVRQHGYLGGGRTDQILPPGMPGFRDANIYSLRGANPSRASTLARGNTRGGKAVFYAFTTVPGPQIAQVVQFNLRQIGVDVEIKQFDRVVQHEKVGTRGEPFDISHSGWGADYPDPYNFINVLLDGTRIQATNNVNESYFNNPTYNRKMEQASRLFGAARLRTYGNLDIDIMRNQAPLAPYINTNARIFVSQDVGPYTFSGVNSATNLVATGKK
jgi:peptide/nickel transport system substrate-binding protein